MPNVLSDEEKSQVRRHLGYPEVGNQAASLQYGLPKAVPFAFALEMAMGLLENESGVARVRQLLCVLNRIEQQMLAALCQVGVAEVDNIKLHPLASFTHELVTDNLEKEYVRWASRLADVFAVPLYAYAARFQKLAPGRNIGVIG